MNCAPPCYNVEGLDWPQLSLFLHLLFLIPIMPLCNPAGGCGRLYEGNCDTLTSMNNTAMLVYETTQLVLSISLHRANSARPCLLSGHVLHMLYHLSGSKLRNATARILTHERRRYDIVDTATQTGGDQLMVPEAKLWLEKLLAPHSIYIFSLVS